MGMMNIGMKRGRDSEFNSITAMANCLMLLSGATGDFEVLNNITNVSNNAGHHLSPSRVFECKTCNRQFPSFQALGGHRASHKKPKLGGDLSLQSHVATSPPKPKTHECSICGQEFAVGQALGGHMRRHRAAAAADNNHRDDRNRHQSPVSSSISSQTTTNVSHDHDDSDVKKKSNNDDYKRVWGLDLNLTPLENDDLDFGLGKRIVPHPATLLDCVL
ncbi:OLC1v1027703C1 [Oldenlandia corymbosa var. corymbosa]|uniref:OLC1v1027703C1 n=1 Tax=Oldenlandia corymbosa var. corymbosa TaxID=529605 RepID=A0AAV1CB91_OLDCO|nr:OLC1v1027703C1 [Oldenlandia corymbosa var. corymbosa]